MLVKIHVNSPLADKIGTYRDSNTESAFFDLRMADDLTTIPQPSAEHAQT